MTTASDNKRSSVYIVGESSASDIKHTRGVTNASIGSLALVELQIVLQFLSARERVIASACCKDMLSASRHAVSWRYDPFCLETTVAAEKERVYAGTYTSQFSLALFAKKRLFFWRTFSMYDIRPEEASKIANIPNLTALEAPWVTKEEMAIVFRPALSLTGYKTITCLRLHSTSVEPDISALVSAQLPRLTKLTLGQDDFSLSDPNGYLRLADIGSLVHLKDLTINCGCSQEEKCLANVPDALLLLPNLRSLEIQRWTFFRGHVRSWATNSTGMHSLRSLTIHTALIKDRDVYTYFTVADYSDLLSASPLLETLGVQCGYFLCDLDRTFALAALLTTLPRLHTLADHRDYRRCNGVSKPECINLLKAECPKLHVRQE